ncbi:hypothetical protein QVD17_19289 [Tagetes erecta]|uniref:Uncharacterized protein n=1 Tax=Tagetes erecta TaxID=13708 RepID=A0AAD8NWE0_TARER|nr:hypothetical protein QVD17_19289 [Tagetes erecta]
MLQKRCFLVALVVVLLISSEIIVARDLASNHESEVAGGTKYSHDVYEDYKRGRLPKVPVGSWGKGAKKGADTLQNIYDKFCGANSFACNQMAQEQ